MHVISYLDNLTLFCAKQLTFGANICVTLFTSHTGNFPCGSV